MSTICLGYRAPQWPAMRFVALLGLSLLAGAGLAACTSTIPPLGPPNSLRLSSDDREIIMRGEMQRGLASQIAQMLETHPHINAIQLESVGGLEVEGYRLALLIKQYHLSTFSTQLCASACTIAYMAGAPRFLAKNAQLGFHSPSLNGVKSPDTDLFLKVLYQEAGVPQAFIEKVLATAPGDAWFPTTQELVKARIVTNVVTNPNFVPSHWKYQETEAELDKSLKSSRLLAAVANLDPVGYQKVLDAFIKSEHEGGGHAQAVASASGVLWNDLMPGYFHLAPDDLLVRYQRIHLERIQYVKLNAPASCVSIATPMSSIGRFPDRAFPTNLVDEHQEVLIDIITAAMQHPVNSDEALDKSAEEQFNKNLVTASPAFAKELEAVKQGKLDPVPYCQVLETYYEAVLAQPPAIAAHIARAHMSKSQ